jgi:GGDEF domain-containing protein
MNSQFSWLKPVKRVPKTNLEKFPEILSEAFKSRHLEVGGSMGSLTVNTQPPTAAEIMDEVDRAMYAIKGNGKSGIRFRTLG